jgi:hypothetical protein
MLETVSRMRCTNMQEDYDTLGLVCHRSYSLPHELQRVHNSCQEIFSKLDEPRQNSRLITGIEQNCLLIPDLLVGGGTQKRSTKTRNGVDAQAQFDPTPSHLRIRRRKGQALGQPATQIVCVS